MVEAIKWKIIKGMFKYKKLELHTLSSKNRKKYHRKYKFYKFLFEIIKER